jgi:hypothetical protein
MFMGYQFEQLASHLIKEYDYIFYVSPEGVELEDNGVRVVDQEYREEIDNSIKKTIKKYIKQEISYAELSGSTEERIKKIKQTIFH